MRLKKACAGRRSGPQPILHTLGALHSGHGRRLVPEPAVHAEIPQTGNAASACFEGKDMGSGSAWRRSSVSQGRVSDLARGKVEKFSLDMLVTFAAKLGKPAKIELGQGS